MHVLFCLISGLGWDVLLLLMGLRYRTGDGVGFLGVLQSMRASHLCNRIDRPASHITGPKGLLKMILTARDDDVLGDRCHLY
jgi:hypothetical protein